MISIQEKKIFNHFYNVLSGEVGNFDGKIQVGEENFVRPQKENFLYICPVEKLPEDITVQTFIHFLSRGSATHPAAGDHIKAISAEFAGHNRLEKLIGQLEYGEKVKLLLSTCRVLERPVYIFYNFAHNLPEDQLGYFQEIVNGLKERGASVIYFRYHSMFTPYEVDQWVNIEKSDNHYHVIKVTSDKA